jgi:AcrR family transcriptional regulator
MNERPDQRLVRGDRTRKAITRHAADVASVEGLNGLSLGRLAADLGLSKSGVASLFGTKEKLQLATIEAASQAFVDMVVRPVLKEPHGAVRLRALTERWLSYADAETPLFTGGCFWSANVADFDSRSGPVRDALFRQREDWAARLAAEFRAAVEAGEIADLDVDLAAFQLDAVLLAANTALRLGDAGVVDKVRRVREAFLAPPG